MWLKLRRVRWERATGYEFGNDVAVSNDEELNNFAIQVAIEVNSMVWICGKEELPASSTWTNNAECIVNGIIEESGTADVGGI